MDSALSFLSSNWPWMLSAIVLFFYLLSGLHFVDQWKQYPIMRFGRYIGTLKAGPQWREPFTNRVLDAIDIRQQVLTFAMMEGTSLQTHDNVPISFDTILTMQHEDVQKFTLGVTDGDTALHMRTLATVSEIASKTELNDLLHRREEFCKAVAELLQERVLEWGIGIHAVEVRDVKITDESIQEAIALKARAAKEADAELVRAEAQIKIANELSLAAAALTPDGWKLKNLEVMLELCRSAENNTILLPTAAMDAISALAHK